MSKPAMGLDGHKPLDLLTNPVGTGLPASVCQTSSAGLMKNIQCESIALFSVVPPGAAASLFG